MINYKYLRKEKSILYKREHNRTFYEKKDLVVKKYENATLLPIVLDPQENAWLGKGGVIDAEQNYIELSSEKGVYTGLYTHDNAVVENKKVVFCGAYFNRWGDFLLSSSNRLWYALLENHEDVDEYVFLSIGGAAPKMNGNYAEFFKLLGIYNKIRVVNEPVKFSTVIIPEESYQWKTYYSKYFLSVFDTIRKRSLESSPHVKGSNKIYLSRSNFSKTKPFKFVSREYGLDMLDDFFKNNGFDIVYPELLSLRELLVMFEEADVIASVSGSAISNILFASQAKKVLIFEKCVLINDYMIDIDVMKDLSATYVDANIAYYPIGIETGPFVMICNDLMKQFIVDNGFLLPCDKYLGKKTIDKGVRFYLRNYHKLYGYDIFMPSWFAPVFPPFLEAYNECKEYFLPYINCQKFVNWYQIFDYKTWHDFIKHIVKKILRKE